MLEKHTPLQEHGRQSLSVGDLSTAMEAHDGIRELDDAEDIQITKAIPPLT
jgi:hypothetical protein